MNVVIIHFPSRSKKNSGWVSIHNVDYDESPVQSTPYGQFRDGSSRTVEEAKSHVEDVCAEEGWTVVQRKMCDQTLSEHVRAWDRRHP